MLLGTCSFLSNIVSIVSVVLLQKHMLQEEVHHFHVVATHNDHFEWSLLLQLDS
jgi:hypothetical protein